MYKIINLLHICKVAFMKVAKLFWRNMIRLFNLINKRYEKFKAFEPSNSLKKLDHIFTIFGTIVSLVLTIIALWLTIRYAENEQRVQDLDKVVESLYNQNLQNDTMIKALYLQIQSSNKQIDTLSRLLSVLGAQSLIINENLKVNKNYEQERRQAALQRFSTLMKLFELELIRNKQTAQFIVNSSEDRKINGTSIPLTVYNELILDEILSLNHDWSNQRLFFELVALKKLFLSSNRLLENVVYQRSLHLTAIIQQQSKVSVLIDETMEKLVIDANNIQDKIELILRLLEDEDEQY